MIKNYLTTDELCEKLKVTSMTIYRWRKEGLPFEKINRTVRFDEDKVAQWLRQKAMSDLYKYAEDVAKSNNLPQKFKKIREGQKRLEAYVQETAATKKEKEEWLSNLRAVNYEIMIVDIEGLARSMPECENISLKKLPSEIFLTVVNVLKGDLIGLSELEIAQIFDYIDKK